MKDQTQDQAAPYTIEALMQSDCFTWLWNNRHDLRGYLWETNNNSKNSFQGAQKVGTGVVSGVADFIGILPPFGNSIAIELKLPGKKQSPAQKSWQTIFENAGGKYYLCFSLKQFKDLIQSIYGSNGSI